MQMDQLLGDLKTHLGTAFEKLELLSKDVTSSQDYDKLKLENSKLSAELSDLRSRFEQQQESLKLRFDELAKLTKLLMDQDSRLAELQTAAKDAHRDRKELKEAYQESQRELKIAWKKRKLAETERDALQQQNDALKDSLAQLQAAPVQASELESLKQALKTQQAQTKKLKAELAETQRELKIAWKKRKHAETLLAEHGLLPEPERPEADDPTAPNQAAEVSLTPAPEVRSTEPTPAAPETMQLIEYTAVAEQVTAIRSSGLFDENWYLKTYPDIKQAGIDPVEHFVKYGWLEGRNPSRQFDTEDYVSQHPEVLDSSLNPLLHFMHHQQGTPLAPR